MIKQMSQSSIGNSVDYRNMSANVIPSNEYLIQTTILSSDTPSVTFNNLSQFAGAYRHLQLVVLARAGRALGNEPIFLTFNGVGGSSYSSHELASSGGNTFFVAALPSSPSIQRAGNIASAQAGTGVFGATVMDILDPFLSTKNTTIRSFGGGSYANNPVVGIFSGFFNNTSVVDSITLTNFSSTNFVTGSRFSLYGVTA